jgi:NAD(P)-dependent dehydrogenase (short-subunit alcohol dehydrogenase family)
MAGWTIADMPDLTGRSALVTGANSGLGLETSRALAAHGARVVMACRDEGRCGDAVARLRAELPGARLEPASLDLADLDSVRRFARGFLAGHDKLDVLVNNAGVMAVPERRTTAQGFELQLGTNHLGHFALTGLLMPALLRAEAARVVTVSSLAHESGRIDFDDLQLERGYTPYGAYSRTKLANLLFMLELDRRLRHVGAPAISVGAHPGFTSTNLQAAGPFLGAPHVSSWLVLAGVRIFGQSAAQGAEPQLYAAMAPGVQGGDYFGPRWRIRGHPVSAEMAPQARDEEAARRLWEASEEVTGLDVDRVLGAVSDALDQGQEPPSQR